MKTLHRYHEDEVHVYALCGDHQRDQASLGRHVARHLQELALFILPRNEADSDKDISDPVRGTRGNKDLAQRGENAEDELENDEGTSDNYKEESEDDITPATSIVNEKNPIAPFICVFPGCTR